MITNTSFWYQKACFYSFCMSNAAFTCYRNYHKYEFHSQKLAIIGLSKAVHVQFPTKKFIFTIIPIECECSISTTGSQWHRKSRTYKLQMAASTLNVRQNEVDSTINLWLAQHGNLQRFITQASATQKICDRFKLLCQQNIKKPSHSQWLNDSKPVIHSQIV